MKPWSRLGGVAVVLVALACESPSRATPPRTRVNDVADGQGAATLERVPTGTDLDELSPNADVAVSPSGVIALVRAGRPGEHAILLVDSTGRELSRLGRMGRGPYELSGNVRMFLDDSSLVVVDLEQTRVHVFGFDGRPRLTRRIERRWHPLALITDSLDFRTRTPRAGVSVTRVPLEDNGDRSLIPPSDSFLARVAVVDPTTGFDLPPAYAGHAGAVVLGDGLGYVLQWYGDDGSPSLRVTRLIPPRYRTGHELLRMERRLQTLQRRGFQGPDGRPVRIPGLQERLDTLEREILPHFERHGLGFDAHGRLWVIGQSADSVFADQFERDRFLGRQMLPCVGPGRSVSVNGRWIALVCQLEEEDDRSAELQLYRIMKQPVTADAP